MTIDSQEQAFLKLGANRHSEGAVIGVGVLIECRPVSNFSDLNGGQSVH